MRSHRLVYAYNTTTSATNRTAQLDIIYGTTPVMIVYWNDDGPLIRNEDQFKSQLKSVRTELLQPMELQCVFARTPMDEVQREREELEKEKRNLGARMDAVRISHVVLGVVLGVFVVGL